MLVPGRKVGERIIVRDIKRGEIVQIMLVEIAVHQGAPSHARLGIEPSQRLTIAGEEVDKQG